MRGIEVPERTEDFTADPVELFFDLAYVFAFSQLVGLLVDEPTWATFGRVALLFVLLWLAWSQFTWSANVVSGNGRLVRLLFLVGTVTSVPMAASVATAFGPGGPVFAGAVVVIYALAVVTMSLGFERGTEFYRSLVRWTSTNVLSLTLLVAGAFFSGTTRVVLWCLTVAIVLIAMIFAGRGEWLIRSGHFAERHGLIVIIALGEVIVASGAPVVEALTEGHGLPGLTVLALAAAGVFACLLWWSYFDRLGPALEHRSEGIDGNQARGRYVRDVYTWAHAPMVAGIILAAAALEEITLHPDEPMAGSFRLMLFGGLALGITGAAGSVWRAYRVLAYERLAATMALALMLTVAGGWNGVWALVAVDAVLAGILVIEHHRIER